MEKQELSDLIDEIWELLRKKISEQNIRPKFLLLSLEKYNLLRTSGDYIFSCQQRDVGKGDEFMGLTVAYTFKKDVLEIF